jgi:hypothetical protein
LVRLGIAMNRRTLAAALLLSLTFASSQLLAKTASIAGTDDVAPATENVGGDAETAPPRKPADKRAEPTPAKGKPQTQYRDPQSSKTAPRWHRFIPGMIR